MRISVPSEASRDFDIRFQRWLIDQVKASARSQPTHFLQTLTFLVPKPIEGGQKTWTLQPKLFHLLQLGENTIWNRNLTLSIQFSLFSNWYKGGYQLVNLGCLGTRNKCILSIFLCLPLALGKVTLSLLLRLHWYRIRFFKRWTWPFWIIGHLSFSMANFDWNQEVRHCPYPMAGVP